MYYKQMVSFEIDNNELSGFDNKKCFVLGVEWQIVYNDLKEKRLFERFIHSDNQDRLIKLCKVLGANYRIQAHDDWPHLMVTGYEDVRMG